MKRLSFLFSGVMLSAIALVLFVSCQKEQNTVSSDTDGSTTENRVIGTTGSGVYSGSIDASYAAALAANFANKYGSSSHYSQKIVFSAKDLISFLSSLQTKYKSDSIYVNFGMYGTGALPVNAKDNGRITIFFTGNKIGSTSNRRSDDVSDPSDTYLNHGEIKP